MAEALQSAVDDMLRGVSGLECVHKLPGAGMRDGRLGQVVLQFDPREPVDHKLFEMYPPGGTSLYAVRTAFDVSTLKERLSALGEAVPTGSTHPFTVNVDAAVPWVAGLCGQDAYVKLLRHRDVEKHADTWWLAVRSELPLKKGELERVFKSDTAVTYDALVASPEWRAVMEAATLNRNRLAYRAATALGVALRIVCTDVSANGATVGEPAVNQASNCYWAFDDSVFLFAGSACTSVSMNGVLISPSAHAELWLNGTPDNVYSYGTSFGTKMSNGMPVNTGMRDARALPDDEERRYIAAHMTWDNARGMSSTAVRDRSHGADALWLQQLADLGWDRAWGWRLLETVACKVHAHDESQMSIDDILLYSEPGSKITLSMTSPLVAQLIASIGKIHRVMAAGEDTHGSVPTLSSLMEGAETGYIHVPRIVLEILLELK